MPADTTPESTRRVCLQEMGIQLWYPRFRLPHAAASRGYSQEADVGEAESAPSKRIPVLSEAVRPAAARPISQRSHPVPDPAPPVDTAALGRIAEPLRSEPAPTVSEASLPESRPDAQAPSFSFAYLAVSPSLAVICEIPYQSRGSLQPAMRELLSRILKALGVVVQPGRTAVIHFQWPLAESDYLDKGMDSARQTLQGFLRRQLSEHPAPYLLVFSERWPDYLFSGQQDPQSGLFRHPQFPVQMLVTRGLQAMIEDEASKAPAWKQMQVLRAALAEAGAPRALSDQEG